MTEWFLVIAIWTAALACWKWCKEARLRARIAEDYHTAALLHENAALTYLQLAEASCEEAESFFEASASYFDEAKRLEERES